MSRRQQMKKTPEDGLSRWEIEDSLELYGVQRWSQGIFGINDGGNLILRNTDGGPEIDLKSLVDEIRLRGLQLPVLIRFTDILRHRIERITQAFQTAFQEEDYKGQLRGVYPIKVNQHRQVLEDLIRVGGPHHYGMEVGSKPELLIAISLMEDPEALIICNGFKDRDYIETALEASRLGQRIFLVIEKFSELPLVLEVASRLKIEPTLGIRVKLASRGKGLWVTSGGDRSKFGLQSGEVLEAIRYLKRRRKLSTLKLLHFHIGSQISDIQRIKSALKEAVSFFMELCRLGAPIHYIDVGGGLAVDYDGSHTNFHCSSNYDLPEYASDVVNIIALACNEADLPHPTIVIEAGRALVAHHSVLVMEALHSTRPDGDGQAPRLPRRPADVVLRMKETLVEFTGKSFQEAYHDALELRQEALTRFSLRQLSLEERAAAERFFWLICRRILNHIRTLDYIPNELEGLEQLLATTYFCNFSLFQSLPDHWAVKQLFPVVPLHRLKEQPTERAVLADITCDSDGVINQFVDLRDVQDTLPLHPLRDGESYLLGVFLVGAYQEVLGDLHNLFGDTNVVHVSTGRRGYVINQTVEGDDIVDVLGYVQFSRRGFLRRIRARVEAALEAGTMRLDESARFLQKIERQLEHYTYLMPPEASKRKNQDG